MQLEIVQVDPRPIGYGSGTSLVTGKSIAEGPDLSMFVNGRADAYRIADWLAIDITDDRDRLKRIDRCFIDYRDFEPNWLQVKIVVEEEHRAVLERFAEALHLRDGLLTKRLFEWAIDPMKNWDLACGYQSHHRDELKKMKEA